MTVYLALKTSRFVCWYHSLLTFRFEKPCLLGCWLPHWLVLLDTRSLWPRKLLFLLQYSDLWVIHCHPLLICRWCIIDPSLIHRWSIVGLSLIFYWSITDPSFIHHWSYGWDKNDHTAETRITKPRFLIVIKLLELIMDVNVNVSMHFHPRSDILMMIAFITIKSSLVPLIEGLCAQIYFRFEISVVCSHLLLFFFVKEKTC